MDGWKWHLIGGAAALTIGVTAWALSAWIPWAETVAGVLALVAIVLIPAGLWGLIASKRVSR